MSARKVTTALIGQRRADRYGSHSRIPARLDLAQSLTGLMLALFLVGHALFVSSILLGKEAMYIVTRAFEGYYLFGASHPWIVSFAAFVVLLLFIAHALLALRRFPANYRQHRVLLQHSRNLHHRDTWLWLVQLYTGFAMFFLGSSHLLFMLTHPAEIGPYASADRIWGGNAWTIDLLLLLAAVPHAGIGLYRLALKWGYLQGHDPRLGRRRLATAMWLFVGTLLLLGSLNLVAFIRIGIEHHESAGERYRSAMEREYPTEGWVAANGAGAQP